MIAALPKTMRAAVLDGPGPPEAFFIKDVPLPRIGHDHVLIALQYAGVGIWDAEQRKGEFGLQEFLSYLKARMPLAYPNGVEPAPHADGHHAIAYDGEASPEARARGR